MRNLFRINAQLGNGPLCESISQGDLNMYARITTTHFSPYRIEEAISIVRGQTVPAAQQQTGFKGYLMLVDRRTGKSLTITLWEEEPDREVTGANSEYYRDAIGKIVPLLVEAPMVEDFELVIEV